ncbi:MAG: ABC transporter ATP-binding protein, partial [Symbiobacteriaceae bacterium]|nr:ABC transporter ATP-binding protein [Symbiobacteriaceae bacterium]
MGGGWHGGGMHVRNAEIEQRKLSDLDPQLFLRFWRTTVTPYRSKLYLSILAMLAATTTGLIGPMLQRVAIDDGMLAGNASVLLKVALIYIITHTLNWIFSFARSFLMSQIGLSITQDMRRHLFSHIQTLSLSFFDRLQAGRIMSRLTSDVEVLTQLINSALMNTINDFFTLIGIIIIMIVNSPLLSLISFFTIPVMFAVTRFFSRRMRKAYHQVRAASADVNANLQETISGMRVTQSFTREERNMERFDEVNEGNFRANMNAATLQSMFLPAIEVTSSIGTTLVLIGGGYLVLLASGSEAEAVTLGIVVLFLNSITRFFHPIRELTQVMNTVQAAGISLERIFNFIDEVPEVPDEPQA